MAQVQWSNGGRCSGPGEEVRIGRGGRAACGWCPLSEWGFCTGGEAGREVAGGRALTPYRGQRPRRITELILNASAPSTLARTVGTW
mgnify:CR=1 FL=1